MTPEQVQLVRLSFAKVMNMKMHAAGLFYDRLFVIAPEVRPMFKQDMDSQARKLMDTLALAIGSLRDATASNVMLERLGARHAAYGVKDEHYEKVEQALLWALERALGEGFTPQVRAAWAALYASVSGKMRHASGRKSVGA